MKKRGARGKIGRSGKTGLHGDAKRPRGAGPRRAAATARSARSARTAPPPPQQARSRATRRRLLEAAVACFERHGYEATTTAMIAERAGVAVGSVYNHFVDKRAMILELLDETHRELAEQVVAPLDPARWRGRIDPRDLTRRLIDAVFHVQGLRPGIQRILWARYFSDPGFEPPFDAFRDRLREAIVRFLEAVDEQGLGRPGLDREQASVVILNAVQWNAAQAYLQGQDDARRLGAAARATAELVARYVFREPEIARGRRAAVAGRRTGRSTSRVRRSRPR